MEATRLRIGSTQWLAVPNDRHVRVSSLILEGSLALTGIETRNSIRARGPASCPTAIPRVDYCGSQANKRLLIIWKTPGVAPRRLQFCNLDICPTARWRRYVHKCTRSLLSAETSSFHVRSSEQSAFFGAMWLGGGHPVFNGCTPSLKVTWVLSGAPEAP